MTPSLVPLSSLANGTIWALTGGLLTPAAGATAFIYKHGTFTEVTVYTAETGEATLTQPLTANVSGQFPGYVLAEEDLDIVATFEGKTPPAAELVPLRAADLVGIDAHTKAPALGAGNLPILSGPGGGAVSEAELDAGLAAAITTAEGVAESVAKTTSEAEVAAEKKAREEADALKAPLASPVLTGTPKAPTQAAKDNTTAIATDQFVQTAKGEAEAASDPVGSAAAAITTAEGVAESVAKGVSEAEVAVVSAEVIGTDPATKAPAVGGGSTPLLSSVVSRSPAPSGDETGATDTAAMAAAMPSKGQLVLAEGSYYVTKMPTCGPGQGITALGLGTTIYMVGTGTCWRIHNPSFPVSGSIGEGLLVGSIAGSSSNFVIDGKKAGAGSVGVQIGDIGALELRDINVCDFNGAGSRNWLFKNEIGWCERMNIQNCHACNGTENIVFTYSGETYSQSYDYSHISIAISAAANQHGVVMEHGVQFVGCELRFYGNFNTGASENTGYVWKFGADNTAVGIFASLLNFQVEVDGAGVAHTTWNVGTKAELNGYGCLKAGSNFVAGNLTRSTTQITFGPYINWDSNFGLRSTKPGEGLNVQGGSTWTRGFATLENETINVAAQSGDFFAATLVSGANVLKLKNVRPGQPRRIFLLLTQPSTGEAGTVTWTNPGNNEAEVAQTIGWQVGGGGTPALQAANGALDIVCLITTDGQHWYASSLQGVWSTAHIENGAVTSNKIGNGAVTAGKVSEHGIEEKNYGPETLPNTAVKAETLTAGKAKAPLVKPAKPAEGESSAQSEPHISRMIVFAVTGNGSKTEWILEHKLKSTMLQVGVQEAPSEEPTKAVALSEWHASGNEKVVVKFAAAPAAGAEYVVTVSA